MKRIQLVISGRVQGVNFRYYTCRKGKELGLKGWVRNLKDGGVEVVAEGEEKGLKELKEWCKKGPAGAKVLGVEVKWEEFRGEWDGFEVKYFS